MKRPSKESGNSAPPEAAPAWASDIIHRPGVLQQSPEVWADAVCIDVRGSALLLTLLDQPPAPILSSALPTRFEAATQAGILWAEGLLTGPRTMELNGVAHQVWKLEFDAGGLHWKNQREHYRVNLTLKGEVSLPSPSKHSAGTEEAGHSGQEGQPARPCVVRDLSLGGAKVSLIPPPFPVAQRVVLDVALGPGYILRGLVAEVLEASQEDTTSPFRTGMRLRFVDLTSKAEARLSRHITQVQREMIQRGIRG